MSVLKMSDVELAIASLAKENISDPDLLSAFAEAIFWNIDAGIVSHKTVINAIDQAAKSAVNVELFSALRTSIEAHLNK